MMASEIARLAKDELSGITGLEPDTVSGVRHEDDGCHVTVEMVDLERIPPATDVLDTYEMILSEDGDLMSYHRIKRYYRGEATEMAEEKRNL
jgi:hypothetical protein